MFVGGEAKNLEAGPSESAGAGRRRLITRRRVLGSMLGSAGLAVGGAGYAYGIEPVWPAVTRLQMPLANLGPEFEGARLIQISDLHVGSSVPLDYLQKWIDWIAGQQTDWVVVTGDLVHYSHHLAVGPMARLVSRLRAREAVLTSLGNHEYGACRPGGGMAGLAQRAVNALAGEGVRALRNEVVTFRRGRSELHIVGMDDLWGEQYRPDVAFAALPSTAPTIVLSHNPDTFVDLLDRPFDWMLSGHTHGGQVNIPLFGPPVLPVRHRQFAAGHSSLAGKNLYVNRGLGWVMRVRFNARPEVTIFTLRRASTT
ncbi:MAG TPA: metallophosphoesterase [Phycisphaerae bacterium]|nr:metallophosphoesterase [Phycisphaerae bacterium]HOM52803.1 metallophosphoesterase [Phycisphaerae bacterium]HON68515.1 metallophosphoesterase [Phycisphaerae bacterium]HOQ85959.1 metallophosphoesterase [Phycisphaerae bacterium]HPP28568.1 metallophosphoesterase [Phycisphaerae bacterium]